MTVLEFPAVSFEVEGEPETIRETARSYGRFATITGQASSDIRRLSSGEWVGSEGHIFRTGVAELPPHYDTAHTAFGQVSHALSGFAAELEAAKSKMRTLRDEAQQTYNSLRSTQQEQSALKEPTDGQIKEDPAAKTTYDQQKANLEGRATTLESTWQQHLHHAATIRAQTHEAAGRAGAAIRAAGRTSPTADQNWFVRNLEKAGDWIGDRIDDIKGFIKDHANVFRWIADGLKWVGGALMAAAATLAVIGLFIPIVGWLAEIPIGAVFAIGSYMMGAGFALDRTVDWAEGKISGKELLIRAGLAIILSAAGMGVGKLLEKPLQKLGGKIKNWLDDLFGRGGKEPPAKKPPKDIDLPDWKTGDPLPAASKAPIDENKFVKYSMDPGNKNNQGKWKAWGELGYNVEDEALRSQASRDVVGQLRQQLADTPAVAGKDVGYGARFEVSTIITGPNGKSGTLVTVWQFDKGSSTPRLITNWLAVHR